MQVISCQVILIGYQWTICEQYGFRVRDLVHFPTREKTKLDLVLTDVPEYDAAVKLAPIAHNDQCRIQFEGRQCHCSNSIKVKRRLINPKRKNSLLSELASTERSRVLNAVTIDDKVSGLNITVIKLLNKHCPKQTVKRSDRPPWMTSSILKLITTRDEAFTKGCSSYNSVGL